MRLFFLTQKKPPGGYKYPPVTPCARSYDNPISPGNYLKNKGFTGEELDRLSESYSRYQNEQNMLQVRKNADSYAEEDPFWSTVSTYPASFAGEITGGLTAIGDTIQHTLGFSNYHSLDTNKPGYMPTVYSDTTRQAVSEDFTQIQRLHYGNTNEFIDDLIMDVALNGAVKGFGNENTGEIAKVLYEMLGTYGEKVRDGILSGATTEESIASGAISAGIEWLSANVDVDQLLGIKNAENWDKLAIELVEGVGEISKNKLAAIGNLVIQTSLFAENSDFEQDVNALVQTGISEEEAKRTIYKQYVAELEYASVLEYLSDYLDD